MKEQNIQKLILVAASSLGATLHRNNIGSYKTQEGYRISYGVGGPGGSDLIGWTHDGIFLAIEVKTKTGRASDKQLNFIDQVKKSGGRAGIARSADDAIKIIRGDM